jgi:hypothetical protein
MARLTPKTSLPKASCRLGGFRGGFRGTLKQSQPGEFVGKVKEWCDSRCEWKRQVATIRIQKIDCTD